MSQLPTPKASDADRGGDPERWKGAKSMGGRRSNLVDAATHFLPTPTTQPMTGNGHARHLGGEVKELLPTPAVNDMGEGKTVEWWDEWTAKMQATHGNGNGHGRSLAIEAQRLLPTPNAMDGHGATTPEAAKDWEHRGVNLPERIQRLRGATTPPPSDDTSTSPAGPPPHPSTTRDA